jgi:hypothetical protein
MQVYTQCFLNFPSLCNICDFKYSVHESGCYCLYVNLETIF